jgi:hypothetical protein
MFDPPSRLLEFWHITVRSEPVVAELWTNPLWFEIRVFLRSSDDR